MTQYTHKYVRAQFCNNFVDDNGVVHTGPCSHKTQYHGPHCEECGRERDHSVHQVPKETI